MSFVEFAYQDSPVWVDPTDVTAIYVDGPYVVLALRTGTTLQIDDISAARAKDRITDALDNAHTEALFGKMRVAHADHSEAG